MNEVRFGPDPARIGVYGGTFDPVHHGHLVAAAEVCAVLSLDRLVFMPAGRPPHKGGQAISPAAQRVRMLELAIEGRPRFAVSTLDLGDDRPSFTAALLARLRDAWGERHELFFVMGEGLKVQFHDPVLIVTEPGKAVLFREAIHHPVTAYKPDPESEETCEAARAYMSEAYGRRELGVLLVRLDYWGGSIRCPEPGSEWITVQFAPPSAP